MPIKNPSHPGDFVRTEIIGPAGLSVTAAAATLGISRPTLSSLLSPTSTVCYGFSPVSGSKGFIFSDRYQQG